MDERRHKQIVWECKCDCGNRSLVPSYNLTSGNTKSCGCIGKNVLGNATRTHGKSDTAEYNTWLRMKQRCNDPNCERYPRYGGRGIKICSRWQVFENFFQDMGPKPSPIYSIERVNNDGDYDPSNCKWATRDEQYSNTSRNVFFEFGGVVKTMMQWCRHYNICEGTVRRRIKLGWSPDVAFSKPPRKYHDNTQC